MNMVTRRNLLQGAAVTPAMLAFMAEAAGTPNVKTLIDQKIDSIENPEVFLQVVELGSGVQAGAHRHPGPVFGYVIEGELLTQVEGTGPVTYKAGDAFYEPAGHVHLQAKNAGQGGVTRVVAVVIGKQGSPPVLAK
jgi:quercetin dioxygenase-like cupin family protein